MPASLYFLVTGRVQGVGFRAYTIGEAKRLGLVGWCRNTSDGRAVEGVAQGDKTGLEEFKGLLRKGPGKVERVKEEESEVDGLEYYKFAVRR